MKHRTAVSRLLLCASLVALAACKKPPADGLHIESCKTTSEGIDASITFKHEGASTSPEAAEGGQIHVEVIDTDWGPNVKSISSMKSTACETKVPVSAGIVDGKSNTATFHFVMACRRAGPTVSRNVDVTLIPSSGPPATDTNMLQSYDAATNKIVFSR